MTKMMIRAALVAAAATLATACASTPQYPTVAGRAPGTGPQAPRPAYPVDAASDPMPEGMPSTPVESAPLPAAAPSAASAAVETSALPPVSEPAPEPQPQYEAPPEPVMVPVTKTVTLAPG